jgi:ribonucleoside-diphosphate reductase alpha chain
VIHLSNLCTEILEVTSSDETAVCNLGSINLAHHFDEHGEFDFEKLAETVRLAVRQLDRVIDLNFYPIDTARRGNLRWRPVGLGCMGLQDVFFRKRLPFDSAEARALSAKIAEEIYFHALETSCELAQERGKHPSFADTRAASGELQFDAWNVVPEDTARWDALRERIKEHGLRNSLLIAIAPTATIASIAGCYECIEPQVSNLFKRETLSGDFLQVNRYLVDELKKLGLWTPEMRDAIKLAEGSIQAWRRFRNAARGLPHRVGTADALADRHGRRSRRLHRPVGLAQPVHGKPEHRRDVVHVHVRLEEGHQDHLLPAFAPGHQDRQDHGQRAARPADEAVACSLENPEACEACQ